MSQTKLNHAIANELDRAVESISQVILGKDQQIRLALACLVAKGHLLIEDMPGSGKTTLAHVIAQVMGLDFHRIQFTSDLLPTDVLGLSVYNRDRNNFEFHPGPIFSNLVLADEVNRATPKTQSALLEAMEEHQVTVEGETRPLIFIPRLKVMVMLGKSHRNAGFRRFNFSSNGQHADLCYYGYDKAGEMHGQMMMSSISKEMIAFHQAMIDSTYAGLIWSPSEVDHLICHQVGQRPHKKMARVAHVPVNRAPITYRHLGNITSATIPVNLYFNRPEKGDKVLILGAGSGLSVSQTGMVF